MKDFQFISHHITFFIRATQWRSLTSQCSLSKLDKDAKLWDRLESFNLLLEPFFHGKKYCCKSRYCCIAQLVIYDMSANSCSLADKFDYVIEQEGRIKHMSLHHQRRFAKLVYSAALIIASLNLLHEIEKNNILVQSCKLCMDCGF